VVADHSTMSLRAHFQPGKTIVPAQTVREKHRTKRNA
jgi:hypothetical protein